MAESKPASTLQVTEKPGVSRERQLADLALDPLFGAAVITSSFGKPISGASDITSLYEALHAKAKAIRCNKLGSAEDMLTAQAAALNAMFLELARRSGANMGEYMQAAETYMRLALKAQAQCRATLETLANIKNPPVVYARQANVAHGPQQVNNGVGTSHANNQTNPPNELLEIENAKWLDVRTAGAAVGSDPAVEALGTINGTSHDGRQSKLQSQRRRRRKAASAQS